MIQKEERDPVTSWLFLRCVTLGKSLHLSGPQFPSRVVLRLTGWGIAALRGWQLMPTSPSPGLQPLASGGEETGATAETCFSIFKLPGSVSKRSYFSNPTTPQKGRATASLWAQPPLSGSQDLPPSEIKSPSDVGGAYRLPKAAVRGLRTSFQEPRAGSGTGRPPAPPPPPAPEKTLHYWKPGQAEGVEVAVLEETSQGQPNLGPRGQQPTDWPCGAGPLACLRKHWP